ncbi:uncharacterized protein isoform X2 [Choristoneura fumiferana]|uniref:uncharacterized protein isoform X2 n=1 Tax=Choristoneura fumiferana TaxID=7141 RepID=UPI003D159D4A
MVETIWKVCINNRRQQQQLRRLRAVAVLELKEQGVLAHVAVLRQVLVRYTKINTIPRNYGGNIFK